MIAEYAAERGERLGLEIPALRIGAAPQRAGHVDRVRRADQRVPLHQRVGLTARRSRNLGPADRATVAIRGRMTDADIGRIAARHGARQRAEIAAQPRSEPRRGADVVADPKTLDSHLVSLAQAATRGARRVAPPGSSTRSTGRAGLHDLAQSARGRGDPDDVLGAISVDLPREALRVLDPSRFEPLGLAAIAVEADQRVAGIQFPVRAVRAVRRVRGRGEDQTARHAQAVRGQARPGTADSRGDRPQGRGNHEPRQLDARLRVLDQADARRPALKAQRAPEALTVAQQKGARAGGLRGRGPTRRARSRRAAAHRRRHRARDGDRGRGRRRHGVAAGAPAERHRQQPGGEQSARAASARASPDAAWRACTEQGDERAYRLRSPLRYSSPRWQATAVSVSGPHARLA